MISTTTFDHDVEPGIDDATLYSKLGFEPHSDGQYNYLHSKARFNVPCCGRRWGKSLAAGHRMTRKMFVPESYNWIVGPTYRLGEKEFRVVYDDYRKLGILKHCRKSYNAKQGDMSIRTPWGTTLEVVSAEKQDSLVGEGLFHVIMSEAAKHNRSTWEQYIEPSLADHLGTADFPSTPQGFNWYHGLWSLGQMGQNDYCSWRFPTWSNAARFPGGFDNAEIQRIRQLTSEIWFNQEYGAMFTAMTGSIYPEWDESVHVVPHTYNPQWLNFLAFDYGYANPFVALDIQVSPTSQQVAVWREYHLSYVATMEHGTYLKNRDNPPDYRIDGMWGDPRGADEAATLALTFQYVNSFDVPWKKSVEEIKRMLKVRPKPQLTFDPSCVNTIRSISQLHVKPIGKNNIQALQEQAGDGNIQHKVDDHDADALRYFIGPYFVAGANSHLSDLYDGKFEGSESQDFVKLHSGIKLDEAITL